MDVFTICEKNGCGKEIDVKEEKQFKGREKWKQKKPLRPNTVI